MLRLVPCLVAGALCLAPSACGPVSGDDGTPSATPRAEGTSLLVSGSGTAMPALQMLAEGYGEAHADLAFDFVAGTNSGGAVQGVQDGTLDLAVVNRGLSQAEEAAGALAYRPFARDPVAFAVRSDATVTDISTADVRRVYGGEITDARQLGGAAGALVVLDRDPDESARKLVLLPLMAERAVEARTTVLLKADGMADALADTPGALGYTCVGYLAVTGREGVRALTLDGTAATAANVENGTYPWVLTFAVVHPSETPPAMERFLDYLGSAAAEKLLRSYGYAPPIS